ncbi:adenylyl cyclase-associated protein 1 isoform X2 [Choristoneura fumiferana]|uniref:adenylyl cyclase-associated protein 1 isoform X2 n=1 Tax=Choristoneura fumiferana TaxID=7141 RepID=UPI003D15DA54
MFKSCCARPSKKIRKSKSKTENIDTMAEVDITDTKQKLGVEEVIELKDKVKGKPPNHESEKEKEIIINREKDVSVSESTNNLSEIEKNEAIASHSVDDSGEDVIDEDTILNQVYKRDLLKKRYSVDYKKSRTDFKRFSVDYRRDSATLEELVRLEQKLAQTNVDIRPGGRRKSTGILKTSVSNIVSDQKLLQEQSSDDDEVFEKSVPQSAESEGPPDPPATPVGRDELALRRHRFFSDLVCAARAAVEHRVRFDPLGPVVADSGGESEPTAASHSPAAELEALIERLERVTSRLERLPALRARTPSPPRSPLTPAPNDEPQVVLTDNMSVNGFQDLVQGPLRTYLELSRQIGGDVATHAELVGAAFQAQMRYIQLAGSRSKPSQSEEAQLLAPTSEQISAIQQFREKNRASKLFNHLSAISESIPALGWVAVAPTPAPYVKEMNDAGQFYTNRVLKEWKEKDQKHVEWCRAWVQLLSELQAYVKQYHTTGLVWSGLRKVTSDMQTHKNPQLRQGPAPFKPAHAAAPGKSLPAPGAGAVDKPPVFARDGKKWLIEYQKGNPNLVVENAEMNNVVYMFRCRDSSLTVRGKVNGVVLDSCTKCAVVFDNLVSSVEFVNCQSVQMQVLGKVPTISVDKTDGCQIYLSPEALDVEIVSSKSSEMNVLVPKGNGDYTEWPVPEQFKTVVNKSGGLSTSPVESKG